MNVNLAKNGFISLVAGISLIATSTQLNANQPIEKIEQGVIKQLSECLGADHEVTRNFKCCTATMGSQLNAFFDENNKQHPREHVVALMTNVAVLKNNVVDKLGNILVTDKLLEGKQRETLSKLHVKLVSLCSDATTVCNVLDNYINKGCSTSWSDLIGLADKLSSKMNLLPKNLRDMPTLTFKRKLVKRFSCK